MFALLRATLAQTPMAPKDRTKLVLGALLHPRQTQRWLVYLQTLPPLAETARLRPVLLTKIYRPYMASSLSCRQRVDALINNYQLIERLGLTPLICAAAREPQLLHEGLSKAEEPFQIDLTAVHDGHREGEQCLRVLLKGELLFNLTFVLQGEPGRMRLVIGRLQGVADGQARERVRQATRDFHACRPATLLLTAARQLAQVLGCSEVLLIGNRQRIALNLWRRWHITANYDQTWEELGAVAGGDGYFHIAPQAEQQIDFNAIASKKRSEAKKKAALLDGIYAGLQQRLGELRTARAPGASFTEA
ncbi:DUF535 family protein [Paucibacter sp. APW11]|uniref:DUF535 family protein n=1 Tax=Roseateles aquae TaxID=3077235 RepID=A0ABU3PK27_9BURK|nr:DUF535 family protein [Paucibacter sp. APW11]MDT9002401.1 DUF535 family protein [Paucibacter sp. APW11]